MEEAQYIPRIDSCLEKLKNNLKGANNNIVSALSYKTDFLESEEGSTALIRIFHSAAAVDTAHQIYLLF